MIFPTVPAPRRRLFGRVAAASGLIAAPALAQAAGGADWPGRLKGRHRQVFDAVAPNEGYPLVFALNFLQPNPPGSAIAVIVLRHGAIPLALTSPVWAKYKIGAAMNIADPETGAPAVKNPFLDPKPGVLPHDEMAIDRLLSGGVLFAACDMALHALSASLAAGAGVSKADALAEWTANIIPGISVVPSGTWAVNRAQEAGCTYCSGG